MKITNKFKWLVAVLMAVAFLAMPAAAQTMTWAKGDSKSLFEARTLIVSNTISITNLNIAGNITTNKVGVTWTNTGGTRVVVSGTGNVNDFQNLFPIVKLWSRADGSPAVNSFGSTNASMTFSVLAAAPSDVNISYEINGGSGASDAAVVVIAPSWDGQTIDNSGNFDFTFAVTPTGATIINSATNAPAGKWLGAQGIAVKRITYADTDASAQLIFRRLRINGYGNP